MAAKIAIFKSTLVVDFDDEETTAEEALGSYLSDNDVQPSYELEAIEDSEI